MQAEEARAEHERVAAELREAEALQAESDARVAELEGSVSELKAQERAMIRGKLANCSWTPRRCGGPCQARQPVQSPLCSG